MNNDQINELSAAYVPPTNPELDHRLRIAEAIVLGKPAASGRAGPSQKSGNIPPTNAEFDASLRVLENQPRKAL